MKSPTSSKIYEPICIVLDLKNFFESQPLYFTDRFMKPKRLERVNSLLREVIFEVIHKEVRNPHINTFITVTRVETSADLHYAKVFVSMIASEADKGKIVTALQSAAGFIAVHASEKVDLRYFPNLTFHLDTQLDEQLRIHKILSDIEKERLSRSEES
jgi:ribosome-binding factor A